jgi:O-methyltransferase involved in polyketide biosynthesis
MVERKRAALSRLGVASFSEYHRVVSIDALAASGPASLAALAASLDPSRGLAIVTEGLIGYFDRDEVLGMWRRFAGVLSGFPSGRYVSDLHLGGAEAGWYVRAFRVGLGAFVRGRVYLHFEEPGEAREALLGAGFASADVIRADSLGGGGDSDGGSDAGRGLSRGGGWEPDGAGDAGRRLSRVIDARV